ncbi:MAG: cysteine hydrolase [Oscillospiraceae bacterium]|jgi:nicotinamidase-related amidase|nr:cysteine hydrolase [Oscillospiraceae bacterium]
MKHWALVIVDVQNGVYSAEAYPADTMLLAIHNIADAFRRHGAPVVYVQHQDEELAAGSEGWQMVPDIAPLPGEHIVHKAHNSAFRGTDLQGYLMDKGVTGIVLTGMVTQYCINATCVAALEHGFEVVIPDGANAAYGFENLSARAVHRLFNRDIWGGMARVASVDEAIGLPGA